MTTKRRASFRVFFIAFILSVCALGFVAACLIIEYNMQQTTYGKVDFGLSYTMEDGFPVITRTDTGQAVSLFTDRQREVLSPFLDVSVRLGVRTVRAVARGSVWAFERISSLLGQNEQQNALFRSILPH